MSDAFDLDGVMLTSETDFARLARAILAGQAGEMGANDIYPISWLKRGFRRLTGSVYAAALSRGVASCLDDGDAAIFSQACSFFQEYCEAAGAEHVEDLGEHGRARVRGVDDPVHSGQDLETTLLRALAARASESARGRALTRQVALEAGFGDIVAGMLTKCDADWVTAHAVDIVRATPSAAIPILVQLERLGRHYDALGEALAPLADRDPAFRKQVAGYLRDDAAKRRILAALGA